MKKRIRTVSIILETENLGMAGLEDLETSLNSLKNQTFPIKKIKEVLIIVGNRVSKETLNHIRIKFPWVRLHLVNGVLDYAKSKMVGAKFAKGDILIFSDSDMNYENTWLENMVKSFDKYPTGYIISGDTRLETISSYKMSLNATWMIQILNDKIKEPVTTSYFPLNNFAIERDVLLKTPIPFRLPLYRNKIPLWEKTLTNKGYKVLRAPGTRGFHAPPSTLLDWWYRMLIYGADFVALADFCIDGNDNIIEKRNIIGRLFKLIFLFPWKFEQLFLNSYKLIKEDKDRSKYLAGSIIIAIANIIVIEIGGLIACFNRNYIFNKISDHEGVHIV